MSEVITDELAEVERRIVESQQYEFGMTEYQRYSGLKHIQELKSRFSQYRSKKRQRAASKRAALESRVRMGVMG